MLLRRHRGNNDAEAEQGNQERPQAQEKSNLEEKTVKELKELAEQQNVEGYSNMKKAELIEALEG